MRELFAIDLGNKQVKVKSSKETLVMNTGYIPKESVYSDQMDSLLSTVAAMDTSNALNVDTYQIVNNESEAFIFGEDLLKIGKTDNIVGCIGFGLERYGRDVFKNILSFSLARLANSFATESGIPDGEIFNMDIDLVLGVPSSDYVNETVISYLKKMATVQHSIIVNGRSVNVNVKNTNIMPQTLGTFFDLLISGDDKNSLEVDADLASSKVGIIDIGGGTILYDTIENINYSLTERSQKDTGIYTLLPLILDKLNTEQVPNSYQLEDILKSQNIEGEKKEYIFFPNRNNKKIGISITDVVNKEIDTKTKQILADCRNVFVHFSSYDKFLFTGGGSMLINRELVEEEITNAEFVPNGALANVSGFYKFGLLNQENE